MSIHRMGVVQVPSDEGIDAYTKLMLHGDGADNGTTITDETGKTVTKYGSVCTKTAMKKFGTASVFLDGSGDYLSLADSDDWYLPDDWTVDFWVNFQDVTALGSLFSQSITSNVRIGFFINANTLIFQTVNNGTSAYSISSNCGFSINTWYHIAVGFRNGTYFLYINGTAKSNTITGTLAKLNLSAPLVIGCEVADSAPKYYTNGYIDEFRLSKGIARWGSNFTPPISAYAVPAYTPTNVNVEIKQQFRGLSGVNREVKEQHRGYGGANRLVFNKMTYIYKEGDECSALTGGWNVELRQTAGQGTVTKNVANITLTTPSSDSTDIVLCTNNSIDLTQFTKLKVDVQIKAIYDAAEGFTSSKASYSLASGNVVAYVTDKTNVRKTLEVDISALNGGYYGLIKSIGGVGSGGGITVLYNMWLE